MVSRGARHGGVRPRSGALLRPAVRLCRRRDPLSWDCAHRCPCVAAASGGGDRRLCGPRGFVRSLPADARQQALVALAFINDRRAAQAMADLTHSPQRDVAAQAAWWMTFRKTNDWYSYPVTGWTAGAPEAKPASAGRRSLAHRALVLDEAAPIDRRIEAALAMAADPAGAQLLIQLAAQNKVAYQLREAIGSVIFSNPDRSVRTAAAGFFARPGGRPRMTVDDVGGRAGDAARGENRFMATCSTCHRSRSAPAGAEVGPDLTDDRQEVRSQRPDRGDRQSQCGDRASDSAPSCSSRSAANRRSGSCSPTGRRSRFATATAGAHDRGRRSRSRGFR